LPWRSLGKSGHLNRPGKKHNSGLGLLPIAVAKVNKNISQALYFENSPFRFADDDFVCCARSPTLISSKSLYITV